MLESNRSALARVVTLALPLALAASLAGCETSSTGGDGAAAEAAAGPGGDGGAPAATFTNGNGYPELTGSPVIVTPSAAKGGEIKVTIAYDADTRYVRLAIYDFKTTKLLVQNWAQAVAAGGGTVQATVSIPSTTVMTDTYYFTFDLCSSNACYDPFKRTTYERTGSATTYTRVGFTSPPLTQDDGPRESGITIPTFTIQ